MTGKEFTLKYEFKTVGELKDKESVYSPEEEHIGLKWRIRIQKFDERLNMFLHTNQTENQEIHVVSNAKILPKNKGNPQKTDLRSLVIYAEDAVDEDTVERILPIADMYETPVAIRKCEEFLIKESKMTLKKKLVLAEFYKLEELKKVCLK